MLNQVKKLLRDTDGMTKFWSASVIFFLALFVVLYLMNVPYSAGFALFAGIYSLFAAAINSAIITIETSAASEESGTATGSTKR